MTLHNLIKHIFETRGHKYGPITITKEARSKFIGQLRQLSNKKKLPEIKKAWDTFMASPKDYLVEAKHHWDLFFSQFDEWAERASKSHGQQDDDEFEYEE